MLWSPASVCLSAVARPHYCTDPDITRVSGRDCPPSCALLGGFAIGARVSLLSPKTPILGAWIGIQASLMKSRNMHVIGTTASIPTIFCTVINTSKCPWSKHARHKCKMAESRHIGKMEKSAYLRGSWPSPRNLAWQRSVNLFSVPTVKIMKIYKCKLLAPAVLKNKKLPYLRIALTARHDIWHAWWHSLGLILFSVPTFKISKI